MSSDDTTDEEMLVDCTPPELKAEAELAMSNLLPAKSKEKYMVAYDNFIDWKTRKNARSFSEHVLLAYFKELAETRKSSTLWALYSMLMATIQLPEEDGTILDYLNEDCWRHVLQFVPARDVVRTEYATRRWQAVVLRYLQGIHISIDEYRNKRNDINSCHLKPANYESFLKWTKKLGSSIVAIYCKDWSGLERIAINCPNVKTLKLDVSEPVPAESPQNLKEHFKCLQHLILSCSVSDLWVSQFLAGKSLRKLEFSYCDGATGECLSVINTSSLQKLRVECAGEDGLKAQHMVSAVEHLSELTELRIGNANYEVTEEIQAVLNKMPKLEKLDLGCDHKTYCHTTEPLSRLTRLKYLSTDIAMWDENLEIVMIGCRELRTLKLWDCQCLDSDDATEVLARLGTQLTTLLLDGFGDLNDEGVLTIIRGCTQLKDDFTDEQYDELERELDELRSKYEDLRFVFEPQSSDPEQDEVEDDTDGDDSD